MYSAYKLNRQGDNIQPWCIPFPIWNQSVVPCPVLTVTSWPAYRSRPACQDAGQVVRYSYLLKNFPQFIVIHTVKGFGIVSKAEVDVFLELSCFFDDPTDIGNFVSSSCAFSKSSLNIWKFSVHILLKPCLENFECYFASMWDEYNCVLVWTVFGIAFGIGMETDLFQSYSHCWVFQICWHNEYTTFTESYFSIWNNSTWIPSPPLALFIMMLLKAHLKTQKWKFLRMQVQTIKTLILRVLIYSRKKENTVYFEQSEVRVRLRISRRRVYMP